LDSFNAAIGFFRSWPIIENSLSNSFLIESYEDIEESKKKEVLEKNQNNIDQLLKLLEDLLTWARSQQGSIEYNPEKIHFNKMLENIKLLLSENTSEKNITLEIKSEPNLEAYGDRMMVNTILRNLITNSIKYTKNGGNIIVKAQRSEEDEKMLEVSVEDNGIGIDESTRNKLFKANRKVSTRGTNNEKGTGLGLMLCKEFVAKHKGKIWVESELGKGSTFYFTIPANNSFINN
jgi:signal transduction histidine kinase